jgi:hypothetical protein
VIGALSPVRESAEMILLRPEKGQIVADQAHCVEGVATVRSPAFCECKSQ